MPDRATIAAATPTCPGHKLTAGDWEACDRELHWEHNHGAWTCAIHGMVAAPRYAELLDETPV